jgi:uncharacterized membrane protein YtjA (UPF0391 family)
MPDQSVRARLRFAFRNYVLLTAALISLVVGYWLLAKGSTGAAPILLVLGYCVLFPLGLALSPPAGGTGE